MSEIILTKGYRTIVSDIDFHYLNQWSWYASESNNIKYACRRSISKSISKEIYLHNLIAERMGLVISGNNTVDHKNRDSLNNLRENIRIATRSQNNVNRNLEKSNTSGYRGVSLHRQRGKWRASITCNYRQIHLGCFKTPEEAARAYNRAAKRFFGEFAVLNEIKEEQ